MLITADGLVIRSYPAGDNGIMLHILTPNLGRISVMAKGVHSKGKTGGQLASVTQLFTYANYELYRKGDMYWLRGGSVLSAFYNLSEDIARMSLATYLCSVADELSDEGEEAGQLLRMLLNSLYALDRGQKSHKIIKGVFELRAAAMSGYAPNLMGCDICGEGYPESCYFDIMNGRLICADCQTKLNQAKNPFANVQTEQSSDTEGTRNIITPVSSSALAAMRYALSAPDEKIFSFTLKSDEDEMYFARAAETYILNQLEKSFDALEFYHSVAL